MSASPRVALLACAIALSPWLPLPPVTSGHASIDVTWQEPRTTAQRLRPIAAWLEKSGIQGAMGAEVADVLSIPRLESEETVAAKQIAFQLGETLHLAQISTDVRREFLLFMVQESDGRVYFYLATLAEGFRKAFLSLPDQGLVQPMERMAAERRFREVVSHWEDVVGAN